MPSPHSTGPVSGAGEPGQERSAFQGPGPMTPIPRCFRTSRALRKRSFREDPGRADRKTHDHPGQHACACTTWFFVCTVNRSLCIDSDRITEEAARLPTSSSAPFARPLQPAQISARCAGPVSGPVWPAPPLSRASFPSALSEHCPAPPARFPNQSNRTGSQTLRKDFRTTQSSRLLHPASSTRPVQPDDSAGRDSLMTGGPLPAP
jgi:hypothetical protein